MKLKQIIACSALLLSAGAATTSCEDMFTADNKLVTTNLTPQDTVYQVMGILQRMQKLADRTVLLGEVRADLVEVNPTVASVDLQQLADNNISTDNVYNQPEDYYAVINNCNIYLANVDKKLTTHGVRYYEKEICAVKCFRAWCYLELAKIYGSVPFITEPVLTADAAEKIVANKNNKADMQTIINFCINDLAEYAAMPMNDELRQKYGPTIDNDRSTAENTVYKDVAWNGITFNNLFIPVRALLAELYLWQGSCTGDETSYKKAIAMYHDYFCYPGEERGVRDYNTAWMDRTHRSLSTGYNNRFSLSTDNKKILREQDGVIPADTVSYYGVTSDLRTIFCSQYANNYYPWVEPSQRVKDICAKQQYCFYDYRSATNIDTVYMSQDRNDYTMPETVGDLRYYSVVTNASNIDKSKYNSNVNNMTTYISKWLNGSSRISDDKRNDHVAYSRTTILYLHLAEALNRAGLPETAYTVLKYGLAYKTINDPERKVISDYEFNALCGIKSSEYSLSGFTISEPKFAKDADMSEKTTGSCAVWPSNVFDVLDKNTRNVGGVRPEGSEASITQIGIHSIGSGDTEFNEYYWLDDEETLAGVTPPREVIPLVDVPKLTSKSTHEDSLAYEAAIQENEEITALNKQNVEEVKAINEAYFRQPEIVAKRQARVAQLILDEEALEGMFEGTRFYDIMRYQMQSANGVLPAKIALPDFIAEKYGALTNDRMTGKPWYLTLPTR